MFEVELNIFEKWVFIAHAPRLRALAHRCIAGVRVESDRSGGEQRRSENQCLLLALSDVLVQLQARFLRLRASEVERSVAVKLW